VNRAAGELRNRPFNSGGWIRTSDLRVMSPTSYQAALPRNHAETAILGVNSPLSNAADQPG
jgi:hypothetical protein